jgi:transketolase
VTHPEANKGSVVEFLSKSLHIPQEAIATLGDMPNDVMMFEKSGLSIVMGNASPEVQAQANFVTLSNEEDGFEDAPEGKPDLILIGTGSEVSLILRAGKKLAEEGTRARIVSMPSWKLFDAQPQSYRDSVLPPSMHARLAVEAGATQGWCKYVGGDGDVIGVDRFGASARAEVVMREYGFTVENICERAMELVHGKRPVLHQRTVAEAVAVWRNEGDPN